MIPLSPGMVFLLLLGFFFFILLVLAAICQQVLRSLTRIENNGDLLFPGLCFLQVVFYPEFNNSADESEGQGSVEREFDGAF